MKFSLAAVSVCALAFFSAAVKADSYADAIAAFCDGLDVTTPTENDVFVSGSQSTVTVTRVPNDKTKTITGLDLYSVDSSGNPTYVQNTWSGNYTLNTQASIQDTVPSTAAAGLYYYRVWVTNIVQNGQHGPDCIKTSRTFKVTTSSHTNADGFMSYAQSLDDANYYSPEFAKGCFGLTFESPKEGDTVSENNHVTIQLNRDSASQTDKLTKVEIYKASAGPDELIYTVWTGSEPLTNAFTVKDHLKIPADKYDATATYYYKLDVESQVKGETCSFQSGAFKVTV